MKKYSFIKWFPYCVLLSGAFELFRYCVNNNLLNDIYIMLFEILFLFLGWLGAKLEIKLRKDKKNK